MSSPGLRCPSFVASGADVHLTTGPDALRAAESVCRMDEALADGSVRARARDPLALIMILPVKSDSWPFEVIRPLLRNWTRTLSDPQAFAHEQRCLAYAWTFLGFTARPRERRRLVPRDAGDAFGLRATVRHRAEGLRECLRPSLLSAADHRQGQWPDRLRLSSLALRQRRARHRHSEVPGAVRHRGPRAGRASPADRDRDLRHARVRPLSPRR